MSAAQWILSLALLTWALARNLGTRPVTRGTFVLPLAITVAASFFFLPLPTRGNDLPLIGALGAVGVVLGVAAGAATRLHDRDGRLLATAGVAYATLWVVAIGGRVAFAEWATGPGARTIATFSRDHAITGADAWTAAFVIMALAMMLSRTASLALRSRRPTSGLSEAAANVERVAS